MVAATFAVEGYAVSLGFYYGSLPRGIRDDRHVLDVVVTHPLTGEVVWQSAGEPMVVDYEDHPLTATNAKQAFALSGLQSRQVV